MELMNLFLERRGYSPEYLQQINSGEHQKLKNIETLTRILKDVHDTGSKIVIMPDFDCDGISAGTVGYSGLAQLGFNVALYYPDPSQGYGITQKDIDLVIKQNPDVKYIISCDVGITCYDAFFYAYQRGIKVLITDHHEELINKPVPEAMINNIVVTGKPMLYAETIVDPCQLNEPYTLKGICGAHVFWQVLEEYAHTYDPDSINLIDMIAVFAGIGTIGDMMPIIKENRTLIKNTLKIIDYLYSTPLKRLESYLAHTNPVYKSAFIGLKEFLLAMDDEGLIYSKDSLDEKFLGWSLVPIYNAIKRMNYSTSVIFNIFFGINNEIKSQNAHLAINVNKQRKNSVKAYTQGLNEIQQPFAPFIYMTTAPNGMAGLLANQLMRESGVPTFVINTDNLSGSGRSLDYFPAITMLQNTEFHVAGHEEAFGIKFDDMDQIARFYNYLIENLVPIIKNTPEKDDSDLTLASSATSSRNDGDFTTEDGLKFYKQEQNLKPFGIGFEEPKIQILVNRNNSRIKTMGQESQHLKVILPNHTELIAWNKANKIDNLNQEFKFTGNFGVNKFNGKTTLQMIGDVSTSPKDIR